MKKMFNKKGIKGNIFAIMAILLWFSTSFASYTPTEKDKEMIKNLTPQIEKLTATPKDARNIFYQFKLLKKEYSETKQLEYILWELANITYQIFSEQKKQAKEKSKDNKKTLINEYMKRIRDNGVIFDNCKKWYPIVDDVSFAYDFPTSLTIATWYREHACGFSLPANGDGPFQIVSKNYGTGDLTEELFIQTIIDFIEFSKNKYQRYDGKINVKLDYKTIDPESIINHWALYNGGKKIKWIVIPIAPNYVLDRYQGKFYDASRFGIRPYMLKILEREIEKEKKVDKNLH